MTTRNKRKASTSDRGGKPTAPVKARSAKADGADPHMEKRSVPHNGNRLGGALFLLITLGLIGYVLIVSGCIDPGRMRILGIVSALAAGLAGVFMSGEVSIVWEPTSTLGKVIVRGVGGAALFLVVLWFWMASPIVPHCPQIYRVKVNVVNDKQEPVSDFDGWNSLDTRKVRASNSWSFDIPEVQKPSDGKITAYAVKESAYLSGSKQIVLDKSFDITETIRLTKDTSARIRGQVVDTKGQLVEGARVSVYGHESEGKTTLADGRFDLAAHAAEGESVQVYAIKGDYDSRQWYPSGNIEVTITLRRRP